MKNKGETLIELLVIIAIIGIFSSIIIASFQSAREKTGLEDANYKVRFDNNTHYVESYTKEDNGRCVFLSEKELRFCGDWSVEKILEEE